MSISKKNKFTSSLKVKEEVTVFKSKLKSSLNDIDIIAIHEWINSKDNINLLSSLRAIALLCNIVEGLDELFFSLAKELPNKLILEDATIDSFRDGLKDIDEKKLNPFEYIKTIKNVMEDAKLSKEFLESFNDNLLKENLEVLSTRFHLVSKEEYASLTEKTQGSFKKEDNQSDYKILLEYANSISFKREFLSSKHEHIV